MEQNKPILSLEGQIEHLKSKGVKMKKFTEVSALLEKLCAAKGVSGAENEAADAE